MRLGIRVQLVLALAGLLVLAFVPLFLAVASLTRSTLQSVRDSSARSIGRAVAAHVAEARRVRSGAQVDALLRSEIGSTGLVAIAVYDEKGVLETAAGDELATRALPRDVPIETERTRTVHTEGGRALEVLVPSEQGPVIAMLRTDDESVRARPLVRLVGLYTGIFALALLVFAYMALTRMIVQPIDRLSEAARRVTEGADALEVPRGGARELSELGASLADMTRRLRAEEEALRSKVDELERATEELRSTQRTLVRSERLASVGRLSAGLAHEIGNPIAALLGFEELLLSGDLTEEEQRDFLERMKRETERIHRVLRQLLDFARPAASPHAIGAAVEPGSIAESIDDACSLIRPQKSFQDIELIEDVTPDLPTVALSREQLTQVLINLLLNAADATGSKGKVWVRARRTDENGVVLEVEDDGPGIVESMRDAVFEPFMTTKDVGQGTGLGLAVCRGLVEGAGGTIAIEEGELGGAKFCVRLPLA